MRQVHIDCNFSYLLSPTSQRGIMLRERLEGFTIDPKTVFQYSNPIIFNKDTGSVSISDIEYLINTISSTGHSYNCDMEHVEYYDVEDDHIYVFVNTKW